MLYYLNFNYPDIMGLEREKEVYIPTTQ